MEGSGSVFRYDLGMSDPRPILTLGHSPDPDDAFMWWPITGMIDPSDPARVVTPPEIETGRFCYRAVPADIESLNRRAAAGGDLDITAMSVHAYPHVRDAYALTACGHSMGEGYGPKLVVREDSPIRTVVGAFARGVNGPAVAVPGARTTAFLALSLLVMDSFAYVEMPFDRIIGAVAEGRVAMGLIIHEGQLTYADSGLREVVDLGAWWGERTGLPLPLGANAVKRDLDQRFGPCTMREVAAVLKRSIEHAMEHRARSIGYAMGFAEMNLGKGGSGGISLERVSRFVDMYVNDLTLDAGQRGEEAIRRLLREGAGAGLCPGVGKVALVRP